MYYLLNLLFHLSLVTRSLQDDVQDINQLYKIDPLDWLVKDLKNINAIKHKYFWRVNYY